MTPKMEELLEELHDLTEAERLELFSEFCTHCGTDNPNCQCWNDE